jgi:uncharacterized membrane protein YedE/YeeE
MRWIRGLVAFAVGAVMAASLVSGHVTHPRLILGFLDVFGDWDPGLMFFMTGCVMPYFVLHRAVRRRGKAALAGELCLPSSTKIDAKLIGGAAIFGLGWGMVGVCPGPVLASMVAGGPSALGFIAAMAAGMIVYEAVQRHVPTEAWSIRAPRGAAS